MGKPDRHSACLALLLIELNTFIGGGAEDHDEDESVFEVNLCFQHPIMNCSQQIDTLSAFWTM